MLLSNQQKYILEILKEFKYLRVRQLHALVQAHYRITLKGELYAEKTICTLHDIPTAPADDRSNVCGGQFFFRCCPGRALWEGAEIAPSHTICRNANFMSPAP